MQLFSCHSQQQTITFH